MKPHPRIRKTVKWGGAVVSVVLLVVWVGSGWYFIEWDNSKFTILSVAAGRVRVGPYPLSPSHIRRGWHQYRMSPYQIRLSVDWYSDANGRHYTVPIWIAAAIPCLVTAAAWRLDALARRRARTGFCPKCGYNRTGLAPAAVCPECGAAANVPPPAASED